MSFVAVTAAVFVGANGFVVCINEFESDFGRRVVAGGGEWWF